MHRNAVDLTGASQFGKFVYKTRSKQDLGSYAARAVGASEPENRFARDVGTRHHFLRKLSPPNCLNRFRIESI